MGEGTARSIPFTGTGTLDAGDGFLLSAHLSGGSANGTAVFRTGGSGGTILTSLSCVIAASDERNFRAGVPYTNLHVTVAGTGAVGDCEVG